jgi:hypothetical protein
MIAAIVDTTTLGKVVLYSALAGVGTVTIFALGVSSAAGLLEALRRRSSGATFAWGVLMVGCIAASVSAVVLGIIVMSRK